MNNGLAEILAECKGSRKKFLTAFFPNRFELPFSSKIHDPLFEVLDDPSVTRLVIKAPRGCGKTSLVKLGEGAYNICYGEIDFCFYVSDTHNFAVEQTEDIKYELTSNGLVKSVFGEFKSGRWSKDSWVTKPTKASPYGIMIVPRGSGSQVRGWNFRGLRPNSIIIDDYENSESVRNPDQRRKLLEWLYSDLFESVDTAKWNRIILIGTLLHEDAALEHVIEDSKFTALELSACTSNFVSNWEEKWSTKEIKEEIAAKKQAGLAGLFYREKMGVPVPLEEAMFSSDNIRYYNSMEKNDRTLDLSDADLAKDHKLDNVVLLDPAKTAEIYSCYTGLIGCAVDRDKSRIYVRDVKKLRVLPDEMYYETFEMAKRLNALTIGYEHTSLNEFITQPITNYMMQRGKIYHLEALEARGHKEDRIASLLSYFRNGQIYFNYEVAHPLIEQLLSYPYSREWDLMDAFAYIVILLEKGGKYFLPLMEGNDSYDSKKTVNEEYNDLLLDDFSNRPLRDWRMYA